MMMKMLMEKKSEELESRSKMERIGYHQTRIKRIYLECCLNRSRDKKKLLVVDVAIFLRFKMLVFVCVDVYGMLVCFYVTSHN